MSCLFVVGLLHDSDQRSTGLKWMFIAHLRERFIAHLKIIFRLEPVGLFSPQIYPL